MTSSNISNLHWPPLPGQEDGYTDEFGAMDGEVYAVAGELWPQARSFSRDKLGDEATGQRLLFKAAAQVSQQKLSSPEPIQNLNAYLWQSFKRLALAEMKQRQRSHSADTDLETLSNAGSEDFDTLILLDEILCRMTPETRRLFNLRALGYSYEEIARLLGKRANLLRSKLDKEIKKLRKLLAS